MTSSADLSARAAAILARLRELRSVCEAATPGPWEWSDFRQRKHNVRHGIGGDGWMPRHDHEFICSARTALPILVAVGEAQVKGALEILETEGGDALDAPLWELAEATINAWSPILEAA